MILLISTTILIVGLLLLILIQLQNKNLSTSLGKVVYIDSPKSKNKDLYSKSLPLVCRPDFIIQKGDYFIPIEHKKRPTPKEPFKNHKYQVYTQCYVVAEEYNKRPPYGILEYEDKYFIIDYTIDAEESVKKLVNQILRNKLGKKLRYKDIDNSNFCKSCKENPSHKRV